MSFGYGMLFNMHTRWSTVHTNRCLTTFLSSSVRRSRSGLICFISLFVRRPTQIEKNKLYWLNISDAQLTVARLLLIETFQPECVCVSYASAARSLSFASRICTSWNQFSALLSALPLYKSFEPKTRTYFGDGSKFSENCSTENPFESRKHGSPVRSFVCRSS